MVKPRYPGIVICIAGDMFTGNIIDEIVETNDGFIFQILQELLDHLIAAILRMADAFDRVFVPCVVGNHGRATLRPRMKGRVYTNYEWNLYCQLERYFRHDRRVRFMIPGETDCYFSVLGHRFLLTHGDTLGVKGGDGIIGALGPITRGAIKVGRSEAQIGRDFDTLLMGHWHTWVPRGDASAALVNGSLKGYDEYARLQLRVPYARPSQGLWFIHPRHGITMQLPIYLDEQPKHRKSEWVTWRS
jgi:predicted phosphodiesterase